MRSNVHWSGTIVSQNINNYMLVTLLLQLHNILVELFVHEVIQFSILRFGSHQLMKIIVEYLHDLSDSVVFPRYSSLQGSHKKVFILFLVTKVAVIIAVLIQ